MYWNAIAINNVHRLEGKTNGCLKEMLLYNLVPFYYIYWWATRAQKVKVGFAEKGMHSTTSSILSVILLILTGGIVPLAILQYDINTLDKKISQPANNV